MKPDLYTQEVIRQTTLARECRDLEAELQRLGGDEAVAAVEELCRREQPPKPFPLPIGKRREILLAALRVAKDNERPVRRTRPTLPRKTTAQPAQPTAPPAGELWIQFNAERDPRKRGELWLQWKEAIGAK
jgi:hypothetical protein